MRLGPVMWGVWSVILLYPLLLALASRQAFEPWRDWPYYAVVVVMAVALARGRDDRPRRIIGSATLACCAVSLALLTFFDLVLTGLALALVVLVLLEPRVARGPGRRRSTG